MTTITSSLINYLVSCNNYCNWQSLIILCVSHPASSYLLRTKACTILLSMVEAVSPAYR